MTAPADPGLPQPLDDEAAARVARARATLSSLGSALQRRPLDPMIHEALAAYLDTDAGPAVDCLNHLRSVAEHAPEALRAQVAKLTAYAAMRVLP